MELSSRFTTRRSRGARPRPGAVAVALACLGLLAAAGCTGRDGGPTAHGRHEEHEEHAHHAIPAHRPRSFPEAVRRLRALNDDLGRKLGGGQFPALDQTVGVALDISTWLPEIAAESDMPERRWNEVDAHAAVLASDYQTILAEWSPGKRPDESKAALSEAGRRIDALEGLLASCDPRWFVEGGLGGAGR